MTDETVAADPYDGMTNAELKDELRSRGLSTAGNKDELLARLADDDADPEDLTKVKLVERAEHLGIEDFPAHGSKQEMIDSINAAEAEEGGDEEAEVTAADAGREGILDTHRLVDGTSLVEGFEEGRRFEPADVAGPSEEGVYDEFAARARALEPEEGAPLRMRDMRIGSADFDDAIPEGGFAEHSLPLVDRRMAQLAEWAEANPDATVIPPSLLPPAYQDPTISTPGLPGGPIVR